ncbi:MAG: hypothetical protein CL758_08040 [Chloroflexi bacterium]|nr:hypothetical protein [Chloroflexota bacterium]
MIIDSHAHIFPPMSQASGHNSIDEHMKFIQHMLMFNGQPVRNTKSGQFLNEQSLVNPGGFSFDYLSDVNIYASNHGRFNWFYKSENYYRQYLPPTLINLEATAELMVAQMDYVGIEKAVLQTGHSYGKLNTYIKNAVDKFPDRFWGLAMIDEWKSDQSSEINKLDIAINELGLDALWYQSGTLRMKGRNEFVDNPIFFKFWDRVRELNIPVFWMLTSVNPNKDVYLNELKAFKNWLKKYDDIPVVFTHGLNLSVFANGEKFEIPEIAWNALDSENLISEILFPIAFGQSWDYPFKESYSIIKEYYQRLGSDRLAWGSDMPNVERYCTYKQSIDYIRNYCNFLSNEDKNKIFGDNIYRLFSHKF